MLAFLSNDHNTSPSSLIKMSTVDWPRPVGTKPIRPVVVGGSLCCYICENAVILKLFPNALDLPCNRGRMIGFLWFGFMVISASFINISAISWRSVLLVEEN